MADVIASSVKEVVLDSVIPPSYVYTTKKPSSDDHDANSYCLDQPLSYPLIPVIDFSLLISEDEDQRSKTIQKLGDACRDWGFFMLVNHGVPEDLMKAVMVGVESFFNLPIEEKREFQGKSVLDPIRCGTSFNPSVEKVRFWRDYFKVFAHPVFHFPHKPPGLSEIVFEYCQQVRSIAQTVLAGISQSLGLEECYLEKELDLHKSGFQHFVANLYPPCPQPDLAMGLPPHSDHSLLTILTQNQVGGLEVQHQGKWVPVQANVPFSSFIVNIGDQIEIISNGRYRSNVHRAIVNNKVTRISVVAFHGPPFDAVVGPAPDLITNDNPPLYNPTKYRDFLELQQSNQLDAKSCLDRIRTHNYNTTK